MQLRFPSVAKAGRRQRQGAKGEVVALYCNPMATLGFHKIRPLAA